jgi:uncharacterized membrane protein
MNTTLMLIIEILVGLVLFFAAGYALSRVIGSDEYYDKMLYDNDKNVITRKNSDDNDDNNDIIHHVSI